MREIKFRVQRSDTKEWLYFSLGDLVCGEVSTMGKGYDYIADSWTEWTGLKDKKGVEIYEGDIIRHRNLDRPEDVIMFGMAESFMGDKAREVRFEGCGFIPLAGWIDDAVKDMQWEIIGNIWENKELLQ